MGGVQMKTRSQSALSHAKESTLQAMMAGAAVITFWLLLLFPPAVSITGALYRATLPAVLLLVIVFWLFLRLKGRVGDCLTLMAVTGVFAVSLVYKWQTAYCDGNLIGGLLPWSDANGYFSEVERLLGGTRLSTWGTRRPIFAGLFAVILSLTGRNLQSSLAILVVVNALAVYAATREIRRTYGPMAGAAFVTLCYLFYRTFSGKILTEHAGLAFGCLGLAFLLRGARDRGFKAASYGLLLLTIALNARAGAFFVLPALLGWVAFTFRGLPGFKRAVGLALLAVLLGFGANLVLVAALGSPGGVPFSNYSYTLYGLASGNKGWRQVMTDHPGVQEKDVPRHALEKVKSDPGLFLQGVALAYRDYFAPRRGAFGFLKLPHAPLLSSFALWALTGLGLASAMRGFRSPVHSCLLASCCGLFLSVGLVPPIDADAMRAYAATIPLTAWAVSAGVACVNQGVKWLARITLDSADGPSGVDAATPLSVALLICGFPLPLFMAGLAAPQHARESVECAAGEERLDFHVGPGSVVQLIADKDAPESFVPLVRLSDFRRSAGVESGYPELDRGLQSLVAGQAVAATSAGFVVMGPRPLVPGAHVVCAKPAPDEWLARYGFLGVDTSAQPERSTGTFGSVALRQSLPKWRMLSLSVLVAAVAFAAIRWARTVVLLP